MGFASMCHLYSNAQFHSSFFLVVFFLVYLRRSFVLSDSCNKRVPTDYYTYIVHPQKICVERVRETAIVTQCSNSAHQLNGDCSPMSLHNQRQHRVRVRCCAAYVRTSLQKTQTNSVFSLISAMLCRFLSSYFLHASVEPVSV